MGSLPSQEGCHAPNQAFSPKEMYNLRQVYYYLCLHTTTLTSCQLDMNQFQSLFASQKQFKSLWRPLFSAIDLKGDSVIDFDEFLTFVTHLKRGELQDRRALCFRVLDSNRDGYVEKADVRRIAEIRASTRRRSFVSPKSDTQWEDECAEFFSLVVEDSEDRFAMEQFENYCSIYGEGIVTQTLEIFDVMFSTAVEDSGIVITATDVKNSKPHIDWQDHKIRMGFLLCCSSQPPIFTKAPTM